MINNRHTFCRLTAPLCVWAWLLPMLFCGVAQALPLAITDHVAERTVWPIYDGNGNVVGLVDASSKQMLASIEYTPYGRIHTVDGAPGSGIDRTNIAAVSPFLFSTKYLDAELASGSGTSGASGGGGGLYYYGYRYYDPATGNWLNRDPIAEAGGLNLYAFVMNDPINGVDPLGLEAFEYWGKTYYWPWEKEASLNPFKSVVVQAGNQAVGKVTAAAVGVNVPIEYASGVAMAGGYYNGLWQGAQGTFWIVAEPFTASVDAGTSVITVMTGQDIQTQWSYAYGPGGVLDRVDAIDNAMAQHGRPWWERKYTSGFYGAADYLGVGSQYNGLTRQSLVFHGDTLVGLKDLSPTESVVEFATGTVQLVGVAYGGAYTGRTISHISDPTSLMFLLRRGKHGADDVAPIHKNSLDYVGDTHVYRIKAPDGTTFKIGESAQGVRVRDGASIRAEQQVRELNRTAGPGHTSEIRRWFPDKSSARVWETRVIERFRRMFGQDALPGNATNR